MTSLALFSVYRRSTNRPSQATAMVTHGLRITRQICKVRNIDIAPPFLSDKNAADLNRRKINDELLHLRHEASKRPGIAPHEVDLAGYLSASAIARQPIEEKSLPFLRDANHSVTETRKLLHYGSDNTFKKNCTEAEMYDVSNRIKFSRELSKRHGNGNSFAAAAAIFMSAGNCGEHRDVAAAVHSRKLGEADCIHLVSDKKEDHSWAEVELHNGDRIVMDAWAYGPAVMARDSEFGCDKDGRAVDLSLLGSRNEGAGFYKYVKKFLKDLKNGEETKKWNEFSEAHLKRNPNKNFAINLLRSPHSVLGKKIKDKVMSSRNDFIEEITAIGAARALGANIKQARSISKKVTTSMDKIIR